jgi:hypothetical protein
VVAAAGMASARSETAAAAVKAIGFFMGGNSGDKQRSIQRAQPEPARLNEG